MTDKYILVDRRPVPCPWLFKWAQWMQENDRHVALTYIGVLRVSTVFLGLDHSFLESGPPLLFETMIFDDNEDGYQERCCTWEQAEAMHAAAVEVATERVRKADAMIKWKADSA